MRWFLIIAALIASALGALFGSYLKQKGKHLATTEDFKALLAQLEAQTRATERIKGEVTEATGTSIERLKAGLSADVEVLKVRRLETQQQGLERLRDTFERERTFDAFRRTAILDYVNSVINSTKEVLVLADLAGRDIWVEAGDRLQSDRTMFGELNSINLHAEILNGLGAVQTGICEQLQKTSDTLWNQWGVLMGELTLKDPNFRKAYPTAAAYSSERFDQEWRKLMDTMAVLRHAVCRLLPSVSLPK